jgi:hypothetical protein
LSNLWQKMWWGAAEGHVVSLMQSHPREFRASYN